ncbi:MAG: hypothetical protein JO336_21865, partial [Acidobacteriia bacterium]|nr:hypothetical protein [Terriglobia bacterium]
MSKTAILLLLWRVAAQVPLPAQEGPQARRFLENRDVLTLAQAGYDEQTIIDTLLAKTNRFDTATAALAELASQGVSQRILQAMLLAKACNPPSDLPGNRPQSCGPAVAALRSFGTHIAAGDLPLAAKGIPYRASIDMRTDGRCPVSDVSLALVKGTLPAGLNLTMSGLDGVPLETGRFHFTLRAKTPCTTAVRSLELFVTGKPILEVSAGEVTFTSGPGLVPPAKTILVSSTWPNLSYHVEKHNADWLEVRLDRGRTPEADSPLTGD